MHKFEYLYAGVIAISNIDVVVMVDIDAGRHPEFSFAMALVSKLIQKIPLDVENLNNMKKPIRNVNVPEAVCGNPFGPGKIPGSISLASELGYKNACFIENLNPEVHGIHHKDKTFGIYPYVGGKVEFTRTGAPFSDLPDEFPVFV